MTKIINCKVENILGAKEVEFSPNGNSVTIGGANGQGKSSAIKALIMALGGQAEIPDAPVHKGAEKGSIVVELDDFIVYRDVSPDRKTSLRVVSKSDGKKYQNGQSVLNELFGNLSFDPGRFRSSNKDKQFKILVELLKVDPTFLEVEYDEIYSVRRDKGRIITELEGKIAGRKFHHDAPEHEIDISSSLDKLKQLHNTSNQISSLKSKAVEKETEAQRLTDKNVRNEAEIQRLKQQIDLLTKESTENIETIRTLDKDASLLRAQIKDIEANDDSKKQAEELDKQLKEFDLTNQKVRENRETRKLTEELEGLNIQYSECTAQLKTIEEKIKQLVASAKPPVTGLSISRGQVFFNEIPFEQLAESEQWKVSTAIGFSLNPTGIVFMANCGGLDKNSREQIRKQAAELGVQIFLEVVDDADDVQILIEDGEVKEDRLEKVSVLVA